MTGDNVFQMSLDPKGWIREDMVAIKDKKDKRACGFRRTKEVYSEDQLWTLLKKYDKQNALMSVSIGKMDYRKSDGPAGEQMLEREGLVAGHAYSIIQAREVSDGPLGSYKSETRGGLTNGKARGGTGLRDGRSTLVLPRSSIL